MSRLSTFCLASSVSAAALLVATPAAQATPSGTWMNVSLSAAVHGQSVDVTTSSKGVQHYVMEQGNPNKTFANPRSAGLVIDYGDGTPQDRGNAMGDTSCTTGTPTAPFADPASTNTHHYAKPGTYIITVEGYDCGDLGLDGAARKTVVTVGVPQATGHAGSTSGSSKVATKHATTPMAPAPAARPARIATGPKVSTDKVGTGSPDRSGLELIGAALGAVGGGAMLLRRRRTN